MQPHREAAATLRRSRTLKQRQETRDRAMLQPPRASSDHVIRGNSKLLMRRSFPSEHTRLLPGGSSSGGASLRYKRGQNSTLSSEGTSIDDYMVQGPPTIKEDLYAFSYFVLESKLNLLLFLAPVAVWASTAKWGDQWCFWLNFLVMIPLANMLGEATEALAFHTGETIGGLVNATFGNAVEVVVAVFALNAGEIAVVQSSLIGSVLSNLLLVLGCSFIAGGIKSKESRFNAVGASANSSLLILSSFAMLLPSYIFYFSDHASDELRVQKTLSMSHIAAVFLLFMYIQLLYFQLHTHFDYFQDEPQNRDQELAEDEEFIEEEVPLSKRASIVTLLLSTLLVALFSEFLVQSIDGFAQELRVSKSFIGIVLLPIIGNAVEHVTAIKVALHGKMELAMGVAVGSATQVSLFVVPVVVIAGWIMQQPMTLAFPQFEIMVYFMAIIIVFAIVADGKSNWLEGSMLLTAYALVAVALFYVVIPDHSSSPLLKDP